MYKYIDVWVIVLLFLICGIGVATLYSAAGGSFHPWALKQMVRVLLGVFVAAVVIHIRDTIWYEIAYPFYYFTLLLLLAVEIVGWIGMGAKRWLDLYIISIQPSELMKIGLVLALARYFHPLKPPYQFRDLLWPIAMIAIPVILLLREPDLGTAGILLLSGMLILFLADISWKFFATSAALFFLSLPILWSRLYEYQKQRVLTFLNPDSDPLRKGYHILQSKIALGSGGVWGKGWLMGSQSHLQFLPEKQNDFVFTMFVEEWGFIGASLLLLMYTIWLSYGSLIAFTARQKFAALVALGITSISFFHIFINIAMVMGMAPVVGVPLPLMSYGGTSMLTIWLGQGIICAFAISRQLRLNSGRMLS